MEYNGKDIEIRGYLFSSNTENLGGFGTKYLNESFVLRMFTWKKAI
jgi:hypothetical protein